MDFGFRAVIKRAKKKGVNPVIAEIKVHSPIYGDLLRGRDPISIAAAYESGGAIALSYITAREFRGNLETLREICKFSSLPVLRKDFITSKREVERSAEIGVSALLLIARILKEETMEFADLCLDHGIEPVVEVHRVSEIAFANDRKLTYLINNRDITRLEKDGGDVRVTAEISPHLKGIKISGSGIKDATDLKFVLKYADAALIGTSLMLAGNAREFLKQLVFG